MGYRVSINQYDAEYVTRLESGADWCEQIETRVRREDVPSRWFTALGALQDEDLWCYDQDERADQTLTFDEPLAVAPCVGTVARLDGDPFAHTHAVLSRESGERVGGSETGDVERGSGGSETGGIVDTSHRSVIVSELSDG